MSNTSERRVRFEHYLRTGQLRLLGDVEVKFNPFHDPSNGRFTFAPGGPKERSGTRRSGRDGDGEALPSLRKVDLTQEDYIAQSEQLWASVEGRADKGFRSNRDTRVAAKRVQQLPEISMVDVEAPTDMRSFVTGVAGATAKARLAGDQRYEKTLTLARRSDGKLSVASIGVAGPQGGSVQGIDARTIAIVHVHYAGLDQRPFTGDNSAVKFRGLPSFIISAETGEVWEVGRRGGRYVQRIVRRDGTATGWQKFR